MNSTHTKLPFFALLCSLFSNWGRKKKSKEVQTEDKHPDLYTLYRNLYLDPSTSIRSRATTLNISRHLSEKMTNQLKNIQRNKRV